jgi:hypothetical protein
MESVYGLHEASEVNTALDSLPTASPVELFYNDGVETNCLVKGFKGVLVTDSNGYSNVVHCPTNRYTIVQHKEAFRPIIEGMVQAGIHDFKYTMLANHRWAEMNILVSETGYDGVRIGFMVKNSFDGTSAIKYGFDLSRAVTHLEVVGWRQICSNGLKIKVPVDQAEIITLEKVTQIRTLFHEQTNIMHTQAAFQKIEAMQYIAEAISLLKDPVSKIIRKAQGWTIKDKEHLERLIKEHVGKRYAAKISDRYARDKDTSLWGLYNAITFVASHDDLKAISREHLIDKAADMLNAEMFPEVV